MIMARLKHGPFDGQIVGIQKHGTKWIFLLYEEMKTTVQTLMAEWPHEDKPVGRPPLPPGPIVTYRVVNMNHETEKAEFEYDEKNSDVKELP